MPELPEVERAAKLVRHVALGRTIEKVETCEDAIVYTGGITHQDFAKEITGRKVTGVGRYGKVFYIELDGKGRVPVLHLGMTGMIQVKGQEPTWYRRRNKDLAADVWPPPRFLKFIMHFSAVQGDDVQTPTQLAFLDARRLGRIRLASSPLKEPPISELGFDPILSMPDYEEFRKMVVKRTCPVKALLLDQSFNAGVGNWVADEILFQAMIHPEQRANTLSGDQIGAMYDRTKSVCEAAVAVDADSSRFPLDWLFHHRWGKGQKTKSELTLPDGQIAKIKWLTVGGRTSALVEQLQKMPSGGRERTKKISVEQSDGSDREAGPSNPAQTKNGKRKATRGVRKTDDASVEDSDLDSLDLMPVEDESRAKKVKKGARAVRKSSRAKAQTTSAMRVTRGTKARVEGGSGNK